ncbi:His-Xaa-Ser system radical SAM maturase HxsC [Derxia gummosa]|uniref:His-Xaa-Ser system radical SAM maturase HxsC n=1 Tax=Derxia gummosa DSM 723 TaxID=1121388 RepID=A0A8B6X6U7_9BURK|nr:His-Xaa-Ser system radical SAM maturase HxsC [Derxia gummosa]
MLTLSAKVLQQGVPFADNPVHRRTPRVLFTLTTNARLPQAARSGKAFLMREPGELPSGFPQVVALERARVQLGAVANLTVVPNELDYMADGDVVALSSDGRIRVLYRANTPHNGVLLTEQCNNYCLMCSQPPREVDDRWLLDEAMELISHLPRDGRPGLVLSGGEPTTWGAGFIELIDQFKRQRPNVVLHVLSNGRRFADFEFARAYAAVKHPDIAVGIPVYSADPTRHDYVVQAAGAFDETVRGILNLKRLGQRVEIRVVLHRQTIDGLTELARFIARNLLFVDKVALMGLEMTGFTRANLDALWIDSADYRDTLSEAVRVFKHFDIPVEIYNHQLCLVNRDVEDVYVRSISDWKKEYAQECAVCVRRTECGGFFASSIREVYSRKLVPFF